MKTTGIILKSMLALVMGISSFISTYAADKIVTTKVGETQTLRLPSYITSKAIKGSQWMSTRPDEVTVISQTAYSATVKVKKAVPTTTTCLIHCQYYYYEAVGSFTYMRTGIYDFKVETEVVKPINVSLPSFVSLNIGEDKYLKASLIPSDAITELAWSSSNYAIINVFQNGRILALKEGSSIITVRTSNGLSAICTVTATKPNVAVTSIKITPEKFNIGIGEGYFLEATVRPENATNKTVTWSSNAPNVVSVDKDGKINGLDEGVAIVTAKTSNGLISTCEVSCKSMIPTIIISDKEDFTAIPEKANVRYERTIYKGWNSICLPFALNLSMFEQEGCKMAVYKDVEIIGDKKYLAFELVDKVDAGVPCLVYASEELICKFNMDAISLVVTPNNSTPLKGSFSKTKINEGCYKLTSEGTSFALTKTNDAISFPFRGYIKIDKSDRNVAKRLSIHVIE